MKQTLKESGYKHCGITPYTGKGKAGHVLMKDGIFELWYANKNHANYGIKYKNTHLEFCCTIKNYPL